MRLRVPRKNGTRGRRTTLNQALPRWDTLFRPPHKVEHGPPA